MNSTDLATAASRAFHADPTAHWGPTIDEVETIDSPYNLTKRGHLFKGPLLIGTARDETCSLVSKTSKGLNHVTVVAAARCCTHFRNGHHIPALRITCSFLVVLAQ